MKSLEVSIGGRLIPLKIELEEEEQILQVVEELNKKLSELQVMYSSKDIQDCMAMTLLTFALEKKKRQQDTPPDEQLHEKMTQVNELLAELV